jgi:hypothetical protein
LAMVTAQLDAPGAGGAAAGPAPGAGSKMSKAKASSPSRKSVSPRTTADTYCGRSHAADSKRSEPDEGTKSVPGVAVMARVAHATWTGPTCRSKAGVGVARAKRPTAACGGQTNRHGFL